jgi:hypothetical protein
MSRKGDCWDNAVAESFFSSFGFELEFEFEANWHDEHDVERDAAEHIDGFYNPRRGILTIAISALSTSNSSSCNKGIRSNRYPQNGSSP